MPRCGSTSRRPTSRPSRSGTAARRASSSSATATRAARTTSTRGRSARSAGATTSSGSEASGRGTLYTYSIVHAERPAAVQRAGAVRRRGRRARRGPAGDDEHRGRARSTSSGSACRSSSTSGRSHDEITIAIFRAARAAPVVDPRRERRRAGLELPVRRAAARGVPAAARRAERVDVADRLAARARPQDPRAHPHGRDRGPAQPGRCASATRSSRARSARRGRRSSARSC